jgi:hypothetical protein
MVLFVGERQAPKDRQIEAGDRRRTAAERGNENRGRQEVLARQGQVRGYVQRFKVLVTGADVLSLPATRGSAKVTEADVTVNASGQKGLDLGDANGRTNWVHSFSRMANPMKTHQHVKTPQSNSRASFFCLGPKCGVQNRTVRRGPKLGHAANLNALLCVLPNITGSNLNSEDTS